jgi:hypothetical protein
MFPISPTCFTEAVMTKMFCPSRLLEKKAIKAKTSISGLNVF